MTIHEGDQIQAAVLSLQNEGEQVGLPELIGLGALEVTDVVGMGPGERMRMVRLVKSGNWLPRGAPRGWSRRPAGPWDSIFFFQA